jgi:hypothetical protein
MQPLRSRVERLEQRDDTETSLMVIVGEPTADQQRLLDAGKVRLLVQMPSNGRGDDGREQR